MSNQNKTKDKEFGTIKMTRTDDGLRLDISGDMAKCYCGCGPDSSGSQSESDYCSTDEKKTDKNNCC